MNQQFAAELEDERELQRSMRLTCTWKRQMKQMNRTKLMKQFLNAEGVMSRAQAILLESLECIYALKKFHNLLQGIRQAHDLVDHQRTRTYCIRLFCVGAYLLAA